MRRTYLILLIIILGKYTDCSAQTYTIEDLYGIWIPTDRSPGMVEFDQVNDEYYDSEEALSKRRSLFISPHEIAYIPGGYEISFQFSLGGDMNKNNFAQATLGKHRFIPDSAFYVGDTLFIRVIEKKENNEELETSIKIILENQDLAYFKVGEHDFVKLSRRQQPELMDYITLFGLERTFNDDVFKSYYPDVVSLNKVPKQLCSIWQSKKNNPKKGSGWVYSIFPDGIHTLNNVWQLDQAFHFDSTYVVIAKSSFHSTQKAFTIHQFRDYIEIQHINLTTTASPEIWKSNLVIKNGNRTQIEIEQLPQSFFQSYSHFPKNALPTIFTGIEKFQLNKKGHALINNQPYKLKRIYERLNGHVDFETIDLDNIYFLEFADEKKVFLAYCNVVKGKLRNIIIPKGYSLQNPNYDSSKYIDKVYFSAGTYYWILFAELLGLSIMLVIGGYLFHRLFLLPRRLKNRLTTIQFEGVKSQLNPHFLFNSMASIQSLLNQRKTKEANRYLNELSDLLRYHLDTGAEELVPLAEELEAIEHYCELEKLRGPFELNFEIDQRINSDQIELPGQLLQPIVENAIKHGLRKVDNPKLRIRIQQLEDSFSILIEDNGPGIGKQEKVKEGLPTLRKTHKGLTLVRKKIALLKKRGVHLVFNMEDRQENLSDMEPGTLVRIEIPLNL